MYELKMLAVDLGASSGRGIVGGFDGKRLSVSEIHRFKNEPAIINGRMQWDIVSIYNNMKKALVECKLGYEKISSLGIDTWGVDYGFIDKNGRFMYNPTHYRDSRTANITDYIGRFISVDEIYSITGIQTMNFNTVFQLAADIRDDREGTVDRARNILFIPDLLGYFLTGEMVTEYTVASTGALLDAKTRSLSLRILSSLGIDKNLFAPTVMPGTMLGGLLPDVAEETGQSDVRIYNIASHDTASAVLSVPAKEKDFIYISSGTWSLMGTELDAPLINAETKRLNYTNEGGAGGKIRFLKNIMGLWILQQARETWLREGKNYSFSELTEAAEKEKPLRSLINPDDSRFLEAGDMPKRIADYCALTGQPVPETDGAVVRCILDSLALTYRKTAENLISLTKISPKKIYIVGGGSQNGLLCRLTADACGLCVTAGPAEATAIGNIAMQAVATGELSGISQAREIISDSFDTVEYTPMTERAVWDEAYDKFIKLCETMSRAAY